MKPKTKPYEIPVYRLQSEQDDCADFAAVTERRGQSAHLREIRMSDREQLVAIYLDPALCPLGRLALRIGPLSRGLAHPRHAFKTALSLNADSFILVANRPNGDLNSSDEDDGVAERFARAGRLMGIPLLDYVLLAPDGNHFSYRNDRIWLLEGGDDL